MMEKYTGKQFETKRNPQLYYHLLEVMSSVTPEQLKKLDVFQKKLEDDIDRLTQKEKILITASDNFMKEAVMKIRTQSQLSSDRQQDVEDFHEQGTNFISLLAAIVKAINQAYQAIYHLSQELVPPPVITGERFDANAMKNRENMQWLLQEMSLNGEVVESYAQNLASCHMNKAGAVTFAESVIRELEGYYKMLLRRHTVEGIRIIKHPIITDLAIKIYKNVDADGEIESRKSDRVSAYTMRKAEILAKAVKDDMVFGFLSKPDSFMEFISEALGQLHTIGMALDKIFAPQIKTLKLRSNKWVTNKTMDEVLRQMQTINPSDISFVESYKIRNEAEKMIDEIEDKTISDVVDLLLDSKTNFHNLVNCILARKAELVKYMQDENCFYVCQIAEPDPFSGGSKGAIEVIPAQKPRANLDWILGSGFPEIKEFMKSIKTSHKWHELYLATSPSKSVDKNNVLLIGAVGCGKSEILRAVGADSSTISISANGSDFYTAWAGEAQKNPKRLFEAALKLSNESGKHVDIMIDEIDDLINDDKDMRKHFDLTKEFQILMDGIVSYPNLNLWGATNNPERIPIAMIRRFSKVLIVGELSVQDRKDLLKYYIGHMPLADISENVWDDSANLLHGATGDVVRKVADAIWKKRMGEFVQSNPEVAEKISGMLKFPKSGELFKQIEAIKHKKNDAVRSQDFDVAAKLRDEERALIKEREVLMKDEIPFHLDTFDREEFKKVLSEYVVVTPEEIIKTANATINNIGIKAEIETAIKVYKNAREIESVINEERAITEK